MKINFYATLRDVIGHKTVELPIPPQTTVQGMLDAVLAYAPALRPHLYDEHGARYPHVHIFINGRDAQYLDNGFGTVIGPADTVNIFPPVGGG